MIVVAYRPGGVIRRSAKVMAPEHASTHIWTVTFLWLVHLLTFRDTTIQLYPKGWM